MEANASSVNESLPSGKLAVLGLQHVLVMYAGAVSVPLIVGRALNLSPSDVAFLISADLFCCGIVTLIQSLGVTQWFGIRLPVMMGVTFAAVGPMVAIAGHGEHAPQFLFGTIIAAGLISIVIAPMVSRLLRFFPPVVTGTIIAIIGITLMRVGINWIFGTPVGPTAPSLIDPEHARWLRQASELGAGSNSPLPPMPQGLSILPSVPNPRYADLVGMGVAAVVLASILLISRYLKGFIANTAILLGIAIGAILASVLGLMTFDKVASAHWFALVHPFHFGMPRFDLVMIATMTLVMIVVMIESTGMFLALGEMTDKKITEADLARGLRTDGLGTLIGGIFNTFPYTSYSQNVGLVAVTGVRSRYVCVAGGIILIALGLLPKLAALMESLPTAVLGGAGIVMFGMVAVTGIRILSGVDFRNNRHNAMIVAISIGVGMIPMVAPRFSQWLPHAIHPLIESGILLTSITAVVLNIFFNSTGRRHAETLAAAVKTEN